MLNIEKQKARILRSTVLKQTAQHLKDNPETPTIDSVYVVNQDLEIKHCILINWVAVNRNVDIDIYNLHDVIAQYDHMKSIAQMVKRTNMEVHNFNYEHADGITEEQPSRLDQIDDITAIMPADFIAFFIRDNHTKITGAKHETNKSN